MADRIWQKSYAEGIPFEIDTSAYGSIVDLYKEAIENYGDRVAFRNFGAELSYRDVGRGSQYTCFRGWTGWRHPGRSGAGKCQSTVFTP